MLERRFVLYLLDALLVSGIVGAGVSYWVATTYITSSHEGDPLQKQGGLSPGQFK